MLKLVPAALLAVAAAASGQTIDATSLGDSVILGGNWRFHACDDIRWAQPDFDDSLWRFVAVAKPWDGQGLGGVREYFWCRVRVRLPNRATPLALLMRQAGPYELFVDGARIGSFGSFPPHQRVYQDMPLSFAIPPAHGDSIVVALRFWLWPQITHVWGFPGDVALGTKQAIEGEKDRVVEKTAIDRIPHYAIELLWLLLCCGLIVLFLLQREESEYLWLAIAAMAAVVDGVCWEYELLAGMSVQIASYISTSLDIVAAVCLMEFTFRFLRQPMPKWLRAYQFSIPLLLPLTAGVIEGWLSPGALNTARLLWYFPYWFFTPSIVLWRYLKGNKEAGLLAIPLFLIFLNDMLDTLGWVTWMLGFRSSAAPFIGKLNLGPVGLSFENIADFLFLLSVGALILYRFQKTKSAEARASAELEAARGMQEVMLPKGLQEVSCFNIESAYIPAQEVGGDFFQLFPGGDESLVVVIGDVSGKGVKAAMLVSLILGLLQKTVEDTREPRVVLRELNRLLLGHMDGRFATCCCAHMWRDGAVEIANAGHLSPYCDGREIEVPGGLPLGLVPGVDYPQISFHIEKEKRLIFLSDGVVEARSKSGELYGFERTRTISIQPVNRIAETAQEFGQEDDITVVGIERRVGAPG